MNGPLKKAFEPGLPIVENGVLDPLRVADMYLRGVYKESDKYFAKEISSALCEIGYNFTKIGNLPFNNKIVRLREPWIAMAFGDMATRAKVVGAKEVLFPFAANKSWARNITRILKEYDIDFKIRFRTKPYDLDLSVDGKIARPDVMSPLYHDGKPDSSFRGLRQIWEIDNNLKAKWDVPRVPFTPYRKPAEGTESGPA